MNDDERLDRLSESSDGVFERMDAWTQDSDWLPNQDEWFPSNVFWVIFLWNLPLLTLTLSVVLYIADRATAASGDSVLGLVNGKAVALFVAACAAVAAVLDLATCLVIRRKWNKRAAQLQAEAAQVLVGAE